VYIEEFNYREQIKVDKRERERERARGRGKYICIYQCKYLSQVFETSPKIQVK
jgi:hypothetical protein